MPKFSACLKRICLFWPKTTVLAQINITVSEKGIAFNAVLVSGMEIFLTPSKLIQNAEFIICLSLFKCSNEG